MAQERLENSKQNNTKPAFRMPDALAEQKPKLTYEKQRAINARLAQASAEGRVSDMESLISSGADIFSFVNHNTPLMWAAANGRIMACSLLIKKGASVHAVSTKEGLTALKLAAFQGQTNTCEFLLDNGANVESGTGPSWGKGRTSLIYAAYNGHAKTCKLLISRCAQAGISAYQFVNATSATIDGSKTALHYAAAKEYAKVCAVLVSHGAEIFLTDDASKTARTYATINGDAKTASFLWQVGLFQDMLGEETYKSFISEFGKCIAA